MRVSRGQRLTVLAISLLAVLSAGCSETLHEVPRDLIGVWETDSNGYRGRYLEIRSHVVRFGTGQGEADSYEVLGSLREETDSGQAYAIVYQDEEFDKIKLHLLYDPATRTLQLKNRPQVTWRHQQDAD